ncbi:MAG: HlyC/CorC family transporter [Clostridia bacterium]|nr:HlyC/CorC family transporter [Clostridia bacterium]
MVPLTIVLIVLIILSAFFSATETAYSCANRIKIKNMAALGKKNGKAVCAFADEKYDKLITAILVGNNIVNLSASAIGTVLFTRIMNGSAAAPTVSTIVLTIAVLLFGEITPKYFASVYPEQVCFLFYPVMQVFYWVLTPICWVFDGFKLGLTKLFRLKKDDAITDEELLTLVDEAEEDGTLKEDESELVRSALEFDDLKVEDILVPRVDVIAVNENSTMEDIRKVFQEHGYSRLPVYRDTIDGVIGVIHERDFFLAYLNGETDIKHLVQDVVYTTEYTRISTLLKQLQKKKIHLAAVSDEYGGLVGIVTLEDILEELVGEIWDEHDQEEVLFGKLAESEYWVDGKCELEKFFELYEELDLEDEETDANTVGGWVTEQYGGIPPVGEVLTMRGLELKIMKATQQKVLQLRSKKAESTEDEEEKTR